MNTPGNPDIFKYTSYRLFLQDYIQASYLSKGKSYRAFSKRCGLTSPNYFQQIFAFQRNMSQQTAEKISKSLHFSKEASEYFITLVRMENSKNSDTRVMLLEQLKKIAVSQCEKVVKDASFHSSWIHQVIWTLSQTKDFDAKQPPLLQRFRGGASSDEIDKSFDFLLSKGYLIHDETLSRYRAQPIRIETDDDLQNLDLQRNHARFLQMAVLRMSDDLLERELQGLTIAFDKSQWPELKKKMREFVRQMNECFGSSEDANAVIRLQMAAFQVAD